MADESALVDTQNLSAQARTQLDGQIDTLIARQKNNRREINRLVFESVTALTAGDKAAKSKASLGFFKRHFTGKNNCAQNDINQDFAEAQFAAQRTLQKLAEQNLLTVELIAAVNSRLNALMLEVNDELNDIWRQMEKIFSDADERLKAHEQQLLQHERRIAMLERQTKIQQWTITIRNKNFGGVAYRDLDDATKIVCLVRDFLKLTGAERFPSDFDCLKTAMESLRLKPTALMSDKNFVRQVGANPQLYNHLLGADSRLDEFATEYEPIILDLREVNRSADKKFFLDNDAAPQYPATVGNYEFALELLYNLTQLQYAKDFHDRRAYAQELFVAGKIDEALPILRELAAADDARARYILALIYNEGINVERDADYVRELLTANIAAGDACSIVYSHVRGPDVPANVCKAAYAAIKNSADVLERHAAAIFLNSFDYHDKAIHELEQACAEGFFLAAHELGCKYYYGRDGVVEDNKTARKYFAQSAAAGYGQSMFILGEMYQKGFGVPVDKKRAVELYIKAYERHSTSDDAINFIGSFYDDKKNYSEAVKWYRRGADKNFPWCLTALGIAYSEDKVVDKNFAQAVDCCKRALDAGCPDKGPIEDLLGTLYDNGGYGLTADKKSAVDWYKKAHQHGESSDGSINCIGVFYSKQENYLAAVEWWRVGADKNFPYCLMNLGWAYRYGHGVEESYSMVVDHCNRAIKAAANLDAQTRQHIATKCAKIKDRSIIESIFG